MPIPATARPAPGSDAQLVVWQPSTDTLWEFWRMHRDGSGWRARWGGRLDGVSSGPGHFAGPQANWGATGTSLPLAGGLITAAELRARRIDHALALALPEVRAGQYALPAQRTDGASGAAAIPEGARFRIDPSLDLDALGMPPPLLAIARAAQRYGMIVRDRGDAVALYGEDPAALGADPYPELLGATAPDLMGRFPWDRVQLVRMELRGQPTGGPPDPCALVPCP